MVEQIGRRDSISNKIPILEQYGKKQEINKRTIEILAKSGKISVEAEIIADFLYSQGGKDGKIPAEVWNKSEFADGRKDSISLEEATKTIEIHLRNLQDQKETKELLEKLQQEETERELNEQTGLPKFGD